MTLAPIIRSPTDRHRILGSLAEAGPGSARELAERLGIVEAARISRTVSELAGEHAIEARGGPLPPGGRIWTLTMVGKTELAKAISRLTGAPYERPAEDFL